MQSSKGATSHVSWGDYPAQKGVHSVHISQGGEESKDVTFVNLDTLGLREELEINN